MCAILSLNSSVVSSYAMTPFMLSRPTEYTNIHTCKTVYELINNLVVLQYWNKIPYRNWIINTVQHYIQIIIVLFCIIQHCVVVIGVPVVVVTCAGCQPVHHQLSMESRQPYTVLTVLTALSSILILLLAVLRYRFDDNKRFCQWSIQPSCVKHS